MCESFETWLHIFLHPCAGSQHQQTDLPVWDEQMNMARKQFGSLFHLLFLYALQPRATQRCIRVQAACLSVSKETYQERVDQITAQMPVKAANNTPAANLIGLRADAPEEAPIEPAAAPQESTVEPSVSRQAPAQAQVRQEDFMPEAASPNEVTRAAAWSAEILALFHAVLLL
jgi:hypothetical protein